MKGCLKRSVRAAALAAAMLFVGTGAWAQDVHELPEGLTSEEINAFLAELSDEEVRQLFIAQLARMSGDTAGAEAGGGKSGMAGFVDTMESDAEKVRERLTMLLGTPANGPQVVADTFREMTRRGGALGFFLALAALIAAGVVAEWLMRRLTADVRARVDATPEGALGVKLCSLLLRGVLDLLSIAAFAGGVLGAFVLFRASDTGRDFVATYVLVVVIVRIASVISRFFFSPRAPQLRLLAVSDRDAHYYHRWILWLAGVSAFGNLTIEFLQLRGTTETAQILQTASVSLVLAVMICTVIWQRRRQVAGLIRGGVDSAEAKASSDAVVRLRAQLADLWHVLATLYIFLIWALKIVSMLTDRDARPGAAFFSLAIFLIVPAIDALVGSGLARAFSRKAEDEEGAARVILDAHDRQTIAAIRRGVRVLLAVVGFAALLAVWGFDFTSATEHPIAAMVGRPAFNIAIILLLAYIGWEVIKTAIDRRIEGEGGDPSDGDGEAEEGGGDPGTRLQTLLPLLRKFLIGVFVVFVALTALSSLGVEIGPLLAGAGVIGIAIGFGAQTLVRDIFSGLFFLIDDAFRVGEYIEIDAKLKGTVEKISVRSMHLRHHRGALHVLPFGELSSITNRSRGWVIEKLDLRLPYDTDVDRVRKIIKRIGQEMMDDPDLGPRMIDPLKSQGVYKLEDSAMIVRAKFTSKPRGRAKVRREAQIRIKQEFDKAGIHFAHRQVTVHVPPGADSAAAGAAAAATVQQEEEAAAADGAKA
ncbi:MAG: mechanosensitive ion channel family protein [Alphaproteobacteria bacterium]